MKVGDMVRIRPRYSEWGCGTGILLGVHRMYRYRVLFGDRVLLFYKHELEVVSGNR